MGVTYGRPNGAKFKNHKFITFNNVNHIQQYFFRIFNKRDHIQEQYIHNQPNLSNHIQPTHSQSRNRFTFNVLRSHSRYIITFNKLKTFTINRLQFKSNAWIHIHIQHLKITFNTCENQSTNWDRAYTFGRGSLGTKNPVETKMADVIMILTIRISQLLKQLIAIADWEIVEDIINIFILNEKEKQIDNVVYTVRYDKVVNCLTLKSEGPGNGFNQTRRPTKLHAFGVKVTHFTVHALHMQLWAALT